MSEELIRRLRDKADREERAWGPANDVVVAMREAITALSRPAPAVQVPEVTDAVCGAGFEALRRRGFRVNASDMSCDDLAAVFKAMYEAAAPAPAPSAAAVQVPDVDWQSRNDALFMALELCSAELFAQCADQKRAMNYVERARRTLAQEQCFRASIGLAAAPAPATVAPRDAAFMDAMTHGQGFLLRSADGTEAHIPAESVMQPATVATEAVAQGDEFSTEGVDRLAVTMENIGRPILANCLRGLAKQRDELKLVAQGGGVDALRAAAAGLVADIDDLVGESHGVYGLHLNGDGAPWDELLPGGRFERLTHLDDLRALLSTATPISEGGDNCRECKQPLPWRPSYQPYTTDNGARWVHDCRNSDRSYKIGMTQCPRCGVAAPAIANQGEGE